MLPKVFTTPKEQEKRRQFPKILKILIVLIILIIGLDYLFLYSSIFVVKNIVIDSSLPSEVSSLLEKIKGQNIFLINVNNLQKEILTKYPDLEKIKFRRGLPNTLRISAESSLAKIIWQSQGHSFLVNDDGYIFKEVEGVADLPRVLDSKDLPVKISDQVASANFIDFLDEVSSKFSAKTGFKIINFKVSETIFQVEALTDQGWIIKFDTTRAVDDQLDALSQLLAEHKADLHEYADVRVEGKVYWK